MIIANQSQAIISSHGTFNIESSLLHYFNPHFSKSTPNNLLLLTKNLDNNASSNN